MDEKKKSASKYSSWRIFAYVALAILAIPLSCASVLWLVVAYDDFQMHQCGDEGEVLEWNGLLDFPAPESLIPISQANVSRLSLLPYIDPVVFPEIHYNTAISHPEHDYFLSSNISSIELYARPKLIVCQPDGWASHVLSYFATGYRFSPDGSLFGTISSYGQHIEIYDARTIELLSRITIGRAASTAIGNFVFHPTEPLIALIILDSIADTGRLYIWNYESHEELAVIDNRSLNRVDFLAFNADGKFLIMRTRGEEPITLVWGIPPE